MLDVIGSAARAVASQQAAPSPLVTFSAALPYLSFTIAFRSSFAMPASVSYQARLICSRKKKGSVAAALRQPQTRRARLDGGDGRFDLGDSVGIERVVDPAALAPV